MKLRVNDPSFQEWSDSEKIVRLLQDIKSQADRIVSLENDVAYLKKWKEVQDYYDCHGQ